MYDFIVVGAGSAGCAVAARLSEDAGARVLLLEAGGSDKAQEVQVPAAFSKLFHGEKDWDYRTEPQAGTANRALYWPRGRMLGGSSSMNAMMYVRGHRSDYDQWAQLGCRGWGYDEVLPYFRKSEDFVDGASEHHGSGGPLRVENQRSPSPLCAAFIAAGESLGLERNDDVNGAVQDGIGLTHVNQKKGRRWSSADAFLKPAAKRGNLSVETGCLVERIMVEGGRASGVAYERGGARHTAQAAREVVLCAGAIGSPQILMLSGIGPAGGLKELGIDVVADLPGVGQNLQDHVATGITFACTQPVTLASAETLGNLMRYLFARKGPLTSNVGEALAFVRTREGLSAPDIELIMAPAYFMEHGAANPEGHGVTVAAILLRPESRGVITLKSADPRAHPAITPNYLSAQADVDTLTAGVRLARKVSQTPAFEPYRGAEVWPGADVQSDEEIETYLRERIETLYHPVGTCRMGTDETAVVDAALKVRGVEGLRVADASIMPTLIGGHTHAPAVMIGEKAADLMRSTQ